MLVYVGYDRRDDLAWKVCRYSLIKNSAGGDVPMVIPLVQDSLRAAGIYKRPKDAKASTDFSLTRFYVPYLAWEHRKRSGGIPGRYKWAVYCDCDFLFNGSISSITEGIEPGKTVYMVKHGYVPRKDRKLDCRAQIPYPRKNWSSLMLFDIAKAAASPAFDIKWLNSPRLEISELNEFRRLEDAEIGSLDKTWNHLVGEYDAPDKGAKTLTEATSDTPKALHYTLGGPWLEEPGSADYQELWLDWECRADDGDASAPRRIIY